MKKKNILLIFISVPIILLFLAQIDDDLDKKATDLISKIEKDEVSESYLYLSGILSANGKAPIYAGKKILEQTQRLDTDHSISKYPEVAVVSLPKREEFCRIEKNGCIKTLFSTEIDSDGLLREHRELVHRANKFLEFKEYRTLSKPTIHEQLPPYEYITVAERIKVLNAISIYNSGDPNAAVASLLSQFSTLRKAFALQDNVIGKLVFLMKLSEIIDVLSIIVFESGVEVDIVPSLTLLEKNIPTTLAREFGFSYYMFTNLDRHPEIFEMGNKLPSWVSRIVYKPNMTINSMIPMYARLEHLSELSPSDFAREVEIKNDANPPRSILRNFVGGVLASTAQPNLDQYIAKFTDLDVKIALFNQIHHSQKGLNSLINPYYGDEIPTHIDGGICLSGPLADRSLLRCLKISI